MAEVDVSRNGGGVSAGGDVAWSDPFAVISRAKTKSQRPIILPSPLTTIVGRDGDLEAAKLLLLQDRIRLVTFTGPGGAGKTRLSVELAWRVVDNFSGGIFLVSLGNVTDPDLVVPSIAETVGALEKKDKPLELSLKEHLRGKEALLILDSFEHLLPEATVVTELLADCPKLKIIVTSQTPLRIQGEQEIPVQPLPLPDLRKLPAVDALLGYAAILLFVQRAQAIRSDFAVTPQNARPIAEICVMLDGLPLALELAAARIRILSPTEILKRMEKRLQFLSSGSSEAPMRQRTLRATIAWSHDLLDENEKKLFRRLSAFVGSFDVEAVESVCNSKRDLHGNILDVLTRLVERSVIQSRESDGEYRFVMLDTIREFALESLEASGEGKETRESYAAHIASLLERADAELKAGPNQEPWMKRLDSEHNSIRWALGWATNSGNGDLTLRMVSSLWRFWYSRGHWSEGRIWLNKALESGAGSKALRARALQGAGAFASVQGDFQTARFYLQESLELAEESGDKERVAQALNSLGTDMISHNDFSGERLLERSLTIMQGLGNKWGTAMVLNNLGFSATARGENEKAITLYEQSLQLFRELGDKRHIAYLLTNLGANSRDKREYDRARELLNESLALSRELDEKVCIAESLLYLASVDSRQGKQSQVNARLNESLMLAHELGNKEVIAECLEEFAVSACANGNAERATRLFAASEKLRKLAKLEMPPETKERHDTHMAATRTALADQKFAVEWARGQGMNLEESIAYALNP